MFGKQKVANTYFSYYNLWDDDNSMESMYFFCGPSTLIQSVSSRVILNLCFFLYFLGLSEISSFDNWISWADNWGIILAHAFVVNVTL